MDYIKMLEAQQLKDNIPQFHVGDTVQVHLLQLYSELEQCHLHEIEECCLLIVVLQAS